MLAAILLLKLKQMAITYTDKHKVTTLEPANSMLTGVCYSRFGVVILLEKTACH